MTQPTYSIEEISSKRAELTARANELRAQIADLNQRSHGSGRLPTYLFRDLQAQRSELVRQVISIEAQHSVLRAEQHRLQQQKDQTNREAKAAQASLEPPEPKKLLVEELVALRTEYEHFAADNSRVSSRRQMAAEFVVKLNGIIRRAIAKK